MLAMLWVLLFLVLIIGGFLFNAPSLDSTVLAPILCTLDGISGTINFALNQIGKKEKFSEISLETINNNNKTEDSQLYATSMYPQI